MKKKKSVVGGILSALLAVLLIFTLRPLFAPGGGGSGDYDSYGGPVLPMTALEGAEGLEVKRNVDFDFSAYREKRETILDSGSAVVTDTYELSNPTAEPVTVQLVYGFEGQFSDPEEQFPAISLNGQPVQTELLASVDWENALHRAGNWEAYKKILTEEDHLAEAMATAMVPETPVSVVRLSDFRYTLPEGRESVPVGTEPIFVGAEFKIPRGTTVWTPGYDISREEGGIWQVYGREELILYFVGAVPEEIRPVANIGYNVRENTMLTVQDWKEERAISDLGACIAAASREYDFWAENDGYPDPGFLTRELLLEGALKLAAQPDYRFPSGEIRAIRDLFYDTVTDIRMLYHVFAVTVPAGESVVVEAVFTQEPSTDIGGPKKHREGYDLVPTFGSSLQFTEQTSSLSGWEYIAIEKQNFGFDLKKGITEVTLDLDVERYFLDVVSQE